MTAEVIVKAAGYVVTLAAAVGVFTKLFKSISAISDGQRSLLRGQITRIYYSHIDDEEPELREYERKMLDSAYEAYIALRGNSFIKDIYESMRKWKVKD